MRVLLLVVVLVALGGCKEPGSDGGLIEGEGTIHQGVGPECPHVWHIRTAGGRQLWPVEDPEFQREGLVVRFAVREKRDAVSTCMAGTIVEVVTLRRR